ncbi:MAG TPA: type II toxin-antitoxin system PemK/MazF family toxin [Thermomicrobiales bacterium]|nr:type II toxin-antitoxin system PemK/MazF family toxin [Thermomicrobiales bacterium]
MDSSTSAVPRAGDVWYAFLDPILGHEQGGNRPVIVVSAEWFNDSTGSKLVIVVPLTRTNKSYPTHVHIDRDQANLRSDSWAMCEQVRALSFERFKKKRGRVAEETLAMLRMIVTQILTE